MCSSDLATDTLAWPSPDEWIASLLSVPSIVRVVESPDAAPVLDERPLVLWGRRVYLQRHWVDECSIAASMRQRAALPEAAPLTAHGSALLDVLLPALDEHGKPELQRVAVDTSLSRPVSLIVGGPGTGKTHTLARLLAVLLHDAVSNGRDIQVALAAPTGKAAQRMKESIEAALASDALVANVPEGVRERLRSVRPLTIHRLLGPLPVQRQRFRHDSATPLRYDVVVIDETSMVAMPLLARLVEAVRPDARLVLVGDPDQLESVELGAVLGDIASVAESGAPSPSLSVQGPAVTSRTAGSEVVRPAALIACTR